MFVVKIVNVYSTRIRSSERIYSYGIALYNDVIYLYLYRIKGHEKVGYFGSRDHTSMLAWR